MTLEVDMPKAQHNEKTKQRKAKLVPECSQPDTISRQRLLEGRSECHDNTKESPNM